MHEITLRLQNYYERFRKKALLHNEYDTKVRDLDVSAKSFKAKYMIEQSYTLFDKKFYDMYVHGSVKGFIKLLKSMSNDHIKRFVHNIFPHGKNTILHLIPNCFEVVDHLYEVGKKEGFVLPFLFNEAKETPLDLAVSANDHKMANSILKMLSKSPLDHHSRFITHLIPKLIDMNLEALEKYFDRRKFQTGVCANVVTGKIRVSSECSQLAVPSTLVNDDQGAIEQSLMSSLYKEQSMTLEVLDFPLQPLQQAKLDANKYEIQLAKSFANAQNPNIFKQKTVRAFIDYIWPIQKKLILQNLFYPYLAFILYYICYIVVLKKIYVTRQFDPSILKDTSAMWTIYDTMFKTLLFLACFYFF